MMRIALFMLTNIAVMAVLSAVMLAIGIQPSGMAGLLVICFAYGMIGSLISLFSSKSMAKRSTRTHIITQPQNQTEQWLVDTIRRQSERAGIDMPEVGIFPNSQPNAFATGWNKNKALVAVSTGILEAMNQEELEAVLGHEIGHIANGDMVTLAMVQGVVNTFVMFFAHIISNILDQKLGGRRQHQGRGPFFHIIYMALQAGLGFLATAIVAWFSRYREYRADEAGARLASKTGMINALERLKPASQQADRMPAGMQAMSISEGKLGGLKALFRTHPPLDDRIAALKKFQG